jgi:hypothetical protein
MQDALGKAVTDYWIPVALPKHFRPEAVQAYQYAARRPVYNKIKNKANYIEPNFKYNARGRRMPSAKFPNPNLGKSPVNPLELTGQMKTGLLGKPPQSFNMVFSITNAKQVVRLKLPINHPINPKNKGEVGRLNNEDRRIMSKIANQRFSLLVSKANFPKTVKIGK